MPSFLTIEVESFGSNLQQDQKNHQKMHLMSAQIYSYSSPALQEQILNYQA